MTAITKIFPFVLLVASLAAHDDIDVQVAALTERISLTPDDSDLYHRRAELHRAHEEFALALADYDQALKRAPDQVASHVGRSSALLANGQPGQALASANRASSLQPDSAEAHLALARALAALGRGNEADKAYTRATNLHTRPTPELFLEHAASLRGQQPPNRSRAIEVLRDGTSTVGALVTLISPLIDLLLDAGDAEAALAVCDQLPRSLTNTPNWLVRRASVLAALNRVPEAHQTYRAAQQAIARLPERRRKTAAMTGLLVEIRTAVDGLSKGGKPGR